jgi:hypothetical protein
VGDTHNIFISWSKPRAKAAALALREWLPLVLHAAKPWMSEKDIDKGTIWLNELLGKLGGLKLGIVCLTPEGLSEPWVLFEVGVICRGLDPGTRIWTYLLGNLQKRNVPQPLGLFQHTVANEEDTFRLLGSVNRAMDEHAVSPEILKKQFDAWWPELKRKLDALPGPKGAVRKPRSNEEMFGEIVEAVRASAGGGKAVEQIRDEVRELREVLGRVAGPRFVFPSGGAGTGNRATMPLSSLAGNVSVVGPLGPGWGEPNVLASGAFKVVEPTTRPAGSAAPGIVEPNMFTPGSPSMGGHVAVPQPGPVASPVNDQARGGAQKRRRMHAPRKRPGELRKTGDEKK